jgi:hypothetical protein
MLLIGLILSVCVVPIGVGESRAAPMGVAWVIVAGLLDVIVPPGHRAGPSGSSSR